MREPPHSPNRSRRSTSGFTLVETLIGVTIGLLVIGAIIAAFTRGTDSSRAAAIVTAAAQLRQAIQGFSDDHTGSIPITETATAGIIPITGALASAASTSVLSNAATIDTVLLSTGFLAKPLRLAFGGDSESTNPTAAPLLWSATQRSFFMSPDAAPTRSYALCNRAETAVVARGTPYDFTPDGTNPLDAGRTVTFFVVPNCPAAVAHKVSERIDGESRSSSPLLADTLGSVLYAAPVGTITTLYVYVHDL